MYAFREWQMKRGFHTAVSVLSPEVVFFLGDLLDEGKWSTREMFNGYSEEFRRLFATHVPTYAVAGNHDVGFHYELVNPGYDIKKSDSFHKESTGSERTLIEVWWIVSQSEKHISSSLIRWLFMVTARGTI